jgi:3-hydroxyacyl-CoA dehydrogenase
MTGTVTLEVRDGVAVVLVDNPPVNAMSAAIREQLAAALTQARTMPGVDAIVVGGANGQFIAGGDIREFGKPSSGLTMRFTVAELEAGTRPAVCAIDGVAMGGGLELAMGCHYRIAAPEARFALPEIGLGIFPGSGGTYRTIRLAGLEAGLDLLVSTDAIDARRALALGLIDEIVEGDILAAAIAAARRLVGTDLRRATRLPLRSQGEPRAVIAEYRQRAARKWRGYASPAVMLDSVEQSVVENPEAAMAGEQARYDSLINTDQTRALRHLFLAERAVWRVPDIGREVKPRAVAKIGVVGAGTMGLGIATNAVVAGLSVVVTDKDAALLGSVRARIAALLKGKPAEAQIDKLLTVAPDLAAMADVDLVIEAVFETMAVKEPVFRDLDRICKPGAMLATNTSGLDVDAIAAFTSRPADVIGLHFFAPANVMKLLEIVRGRATAPDVIATGIWLAKRFGKIATIVGNCPMFAANRTRAMMQREVYAVAEEGATPRQIDTALEDFGFVMGPLLVGDLSGLNVGYAARKENPLYQGPGFRKPVLADRIVEAGRLGQRTAKGWYRYEDGRTALDDPEVERIADAYRREMGIAKRSFSAPEIVERGLYAAINEGAKLLEEGIAIRASDIDVMWTSGYGLARWRGGIMHHADVVGLPKVAAAIEGFEKTLGAHWRIAPLLRRLAAENNSFSAFDAGRL